MESVIILIILLVSLTPTVFHHPRAVVTTEQDASWWTVSAGPTFAGNLKIKIQIQTRFRSSGHHTEGLTVRVLFWSGWKSSSCQQSVSSQGGGRCPSQRSPGQSAAAALRLGLSPTCCSYFCFQILAAAKTVTLSAAVFVNQIPPPKISRWTVKFDLTCAVLPVSSQAWGMQCDGAIRWHLLELHCRNWHRAAVDWELLCGLQNDVTWITQRVPVEAARVQTTTTSWLHAGWSCHRKQTM